jgi:hypothetical protein
VAHEKTIAELSILAIAAAQRNRQVRCNDCRFLPKVNPDCTNCFGTGIKIDKNNKGKG